jgi:hypothetical protein
MRLEDAKLKGSVISFTVTIAPVSGNAPNATKKFQGKVSGDSIKGKVETEWAGETRTVDWEAKRIKEWGTAENGGPSRGFPTADQGAETAWGTTRAEQGHGQPLSNPC